MKKVGTWNPPAHYASSPVKGPAAFAASYCRPGLAGYSIVLRTKKMKSLEANMTNRKTEYGPNNFQRMIRVALVLFMNWYAFPNYYHNTHGNLSQLLPVFSIIDALLLIWISKRLNLFAEADRLRIVRTYLWLKRFEKITEIPYASITGFYWKKRYRNGPVLKISTETNGQKDEMNIPAYDVADLRGLADALSQRLNIEVKESWFI